MKQAYYLTLIILLLNSTACNIRETQEPQKYDYPIAINLDLSNISSDSLSLSEIAEKVEYIPMQTADTVLINSINEFVVTKDYFFIRDGLRILKFAKDGSYERDLFKVGNGPGEAFCRCFAVDDDGKRVYVFDRNKSDVKIYNFDGLFLTTIKTPISPPENWTTSIGFFNKTLFISSIQNSMVKYIYSCFDFTTDSTIVLYKNFKIYNELKETKNPPFIQTTDYSYQINDTGILFKERFCDTLFNVNKAFKVSPKFILNLKDNKLTWEEWRDEGMYKFATGPLKGYWVQSFVDTDYFLFITLKSFRYPMLFVVFNKQKNSIKTISGENIIDNYLPCFRNDLDNLIPFTPMNNIGYLFYHKCCLYSIIEAKEFAKNYKKASETSIKSTKSIRNMSPLLDRIDEFSNPIIMKVYLKCPTSNLKIRAKFY